MKTPLCAGTFVCLLGFVAPIWAQTATVDTAAPTTSATQTPTASLDVTSLLAALKVRSAMAAGIVTGSEDADAALARLKGLTSPMGLQADPDVDFGFAAIDVGQRLVAATQPAEAEKFFRAAEASLAAVVQKTPDADAWNKAQYLQQLALIRADYLNNAAQAKTDIEQAIALQPGNKVFKEQRAMLASRHGNLFTGGTPQG